MAGIISPSNGPGLPAAGKKSATVHSPAGSGSRPTPSKHKIATTAPSDPKGLGRKPSGSLK